MALTADANYPVLGFSLQNVIAATGENVKMHNFPFSDTEPLIFVISSDDKEQQKMHLIVEMTDRTETVDPI